jgi:hypothetical protein
LNVAIIPLQWKLQMRKHALKNGRLRDNMCLPSWNVEQLLGIQLMVRIALLLLVGLTCLQESPFAGWRDNPILAECGSV